MERAAAPALGTLTGFLLGEHMGLPAWAFIVIVSTSLMFGVLASMGREGSRRVTPRQAVFNGGALWVLTCALSFQMRLDLAFAAIFGLAMGLLGAQALEVVERFGGNTLDWALRRLTDPAKAPLTRADLEQALGDERNRTQASIAERAIEERKPSDPGETA